MIVIQLLLIVRYYVISQVPKLMFLDDVRVRDSEREQASRMYGPRIRTISNAIAKNGHRSPKSVSISITVEPELMAT